MVVNEKKKKKMLISLTCNILTHRKAAGEGRSSTAASNASPLPRGVEPAHTWV